jgi:hypothetical protein
LEALALEQRERCTVEHDHGCHRYKEGRVEKVGYPSDDQITERLTLNLWLLHRVNLFHTSSDLG